MDVIVKKIKNENIDAIYLNFPFCKTPCSYCHYIENIQFGYDKIPETYVEQLLEQLDIVLSNIKSKTLKSIYFGGGTASLLNDKQIQSIKSVFDKYQINTLEISIEIHPTACNFNYIDNSWFTRYSIGIQTLDYQKAKEYRRLGYDREYISHMINNIRINRNQAINLDFIFDCKISMTDIEYVNDIRPHTVTFYPNTKGRGVERLLSILTVFSTLEEMLSGYKKLVNNKFIFIRDGESGTRYSEIEYLEYGNIIGVGNNSYSLIGKESFLTIYNKGKTEIKPRNNTLNRILVSFLEGLPIGVKYLEVLKYVPELATNLMLKKYEDKKIVGEKHTAIHDSDIVYLPESEYIRFIEEILKRKYIRYVNIFLCGIGYGDCDYKTVYEVYNRRRLGSDKFSVKKKAPKYRILIEGIDGSGKDTFAYLLIEELKKQFFYDIDSKISVVGQPDSSSEGGFEAKLFIEELKYTKEKSDLEKMIIKNRIASEKKFEALPGIVILIRGIVTDKATFYYNFKDEPYLGEGEVIKLWDKFIVIDVDSAVANQRIEKRGSPRTWRENIEQLSFFRKYFLDYTSQIFKEKIIIYNDKISYLEEKASLIAEEIYEQCR